MPKLGYLELIAMNLKGRKNSPTKRFDMLKSFGRNTRVIYSVDVQKPSAEHMNIESEHDVFLKYKLELSHN